MLFRWKHGGVDAALAELFRRVGVPVSEYPLGDQELGEIPAELAAAYPDAVTGLTAYAELLATDGVVRGLLGPREVPRIWERHIGNCAVLEQEIAVGAHVVDIGSGAGLPGVVLALVRPDLKVTLVEPLLRRTTFLNEVVEALELNGRVEVLRGRAEEFAGKVVGDVVTSRAVAALDQLIAWSWPLIRPGGWMVVLKGATASDEVLAAEPVLAKRGAGVAHVMTVGFAGTQATVVAINRPERQG